MIQKLKFLLLFYVVMSVSCSKTAERSFELSPVESQLIGKWYFVSVDGYPAPPDGEFIVFSATKIDSLSTQTTIKRRLIFQMPQFCAPEDYWYVVKDTSVFSDCTGGTRLLKLSTDTLVVRVYQNNPNAGDYTFSRKL